MRAGKLVLFYGIKKDPQKSAGQNCLVKKKITSLQLAS